MKIIIPVGGLGSRFLKLAEENPEYSKPKPLINIKGIPMVRWATGSLPFLQHIDQEKNEQHRLEPKDLIFVIFEGHENDFEISEKLKDIYSDKISIVIQKEPPPLGAAYGAWLTRDLISDREDIIVTDSDHFFDGSYLDTIINNKRKDTAGIIPVFRARNEGIPKWSYSLTEPDSNIITRVGEKDPELMNAGAYANIGAYYFSKAKHFFDIAEKMIRQNRKFGPPGKEEFYIAPIYQILIDQGYKVEAAVIPEVWGLGTPSDLDYFLANCDIEKP